MKQAVHGAILPPGWQRPPGYSHAIVAEGRMLFIAGQIGVLPDGTFASDDFAGQFSQILRNTRTLLEEAGAGPEHLVRMTWYVTSKQEYLDSLPQVGAAWREIIGRHYPAMAVVEVSALVEDKARIEIESTAVLPATA